jgi:hypothetical protein
MKRVLWSVVVLSSTVTLAGGPERKAFEARIAEVKKDFKATCGCELAVSVKWDTFKSDADFMQAAGTLPEVSSSSAPPCGDAAGKAAQCKLKTLEIAFAPGELAAPVLAGGTAKVTTSRQESLAFDSVSELLDPGGPLMRQKVAKATEALAKASAAFKSHCGCGVAFDIDWASFTRGNQVAKVVGLAESFSSIGSTWQGHCETEASRARMCRLKTVKYGYVAGSPDAATVPALVDGVMTRVTDGLYGATVDEFLAALDPT